MKNKELFENIDLSEDSEKSDHPEFFEHFEHFEDFDSEDEIVFDSNQESTNSLEGKQSDSSTSLSAISLSPLSGTRTIKENETSSPNLPWWRLILLNLYWFAFSLLWFILLIIIVPSQVRSFHSDDTKGKGMFVLFAIGGMVTFISSVVMGYLNDRVRFTSKFGRRRPFMLVGGFLIIPFLFGIALAPSFELYVFLYLCLTFFSVVATVPYSGLFADVVPKDQHGSASAVMGALSQTGNLFGAVLGMFYLTLGISTFVILSIISLTALILTVISVNEKPKFKQVQPSKKKPKSDKPKSMKSRLKGCFGLRKLIWNILLEPLTRSRDFRWVFFTRFVFQLGQYTVQEYLQFWLECVDLPEGITPETAVSICALPMLISAIVSALVGGIISDKLGGRRKIIVYISGGIMVCCCITFMFVHNFFLAVIVSGIFGLGFGAFLSVDFAIVMDVLPSKHDYARDMAVWNSALILPQVLATPLAGILLDSFQLLGKQNGIECLGYMVIFAVAATYFFLGTVFISQIRGVK